MISTRPQPRFFHLKRDCKNTTFSGTDKIFFHLLRIFFATAYVSIRKFFNFFRIFPIFGCFFGEHRLVFPQFCVYISKKKEKIQTGYLIIYLDH